MDATTSPCRGAEALWSARVCAPFRGRTVAGLRRAMAVEMARTKESEMVVKREEKDKGLTCRVHARRVFVGRRDGHNEVLTTHQSLKMTKPGLHRHIVLRSHKSGSVGETV